MSAVPSDPTPSEATGATGATGATKPVGLAPRPPVDPAVLAVLAAAVDQAWPRPVVVPPSEPSTSPPWRFSGRWWTKAVAARRDRPWARG
ncbi:MAG TPA: hypothetical protein VHU17_02340 [Acidimicrobiales bacterium]|nr:hypothetical protein [Acidimicrobiales bacterium]